MASPLPPTLGAIRADVLDRCGLSSGGTVPRNIKARIDAVIRSAHAQLYETFPWTKQLVQLVVPLDDGETDYDVPDETSPRNVTVVTVRRLSDQAIFPLDPGLRLTEAALTPSNSKSLPAQYTFIDEVLRINPPPDTTRYDALVLWAFLEPNGLVEDDDAILVDTEAIKLLAEIMVKDSFGKNVQLLHAQLFGGPGHPGYLNSLKMKQGDGAGFQMGGHQSMLTRTRPRDPPVSTSWQDWHPW